MKLLSSFHGCHFSGKPVAPWGREMTAVFSGYLSTKVSKIGVFCTNFPHTQNQAVWRAISKELEWNLVEMHNAVIKTSFVLQWLWKPSKVAQICWFTMLVRSSPSVHYFKEIKTRTKNHTPEHIFSYLYIHWKYPKLVQPQFYSSSSINS